MTIFPATIFRLHSRPRLAPGPGPSAALCLAALAAVAAIGCSGEAGTDSPTRERGTTADVAVDAAADARSPGDGGSGIDAASDDAGPTCDPGDCPAADAACTTAVCTSAGACGFGPVADGTGCDDGQPCTVGDRCKAGQCNPGAEQACDDGDPCTTDACKPVAGKADCVLTPAEAGTPCDDGSACTGGESCQDGSCTGGKALCACTEDDDCASEEDGDACNGTLYCDRSEPAPQWHCRVNPATVVKCPPAGGPCVTSVCSPATGKCAAPPAADGTPCDDGQPCTVGDVCAGGKCAAGPDTCCAADGDCAKFAKGDLCPGLWFCNKATKKCALNPATAMVCSAANDTPCVHARCVTRTDDKGAPLSAGCTMAVLPDGSACEDGDPCSATDSCKGGVCLGPAPICVCETTADCAAKEDGDACNGTLYCDKSEVAGHCRVNPATRVVCPVADGTPCKPIECDPKTGTCGPVALPDTATCDADGTVCTAGDHCVGGECKAGTAVCACATDADCAAGEDGDACNGTLFCDKTGAHPTCRVNPKTLVTCPSANDTACAASRCDPTTGKCAITPISEDAACQDGKLCTRGDRCHGGVCAPGTDICSCHGDAECAKLEDDDRCNGTLYCDTATLPWSCRLNPGSVVHCESSSDTACRRNVCLPATGACKLLAEHEGLLCHDGNACTTGDRCHWGACTGQPLAAGACDDANPCTDDGCEALSGCRQVTLTDGLACDDGQGCTVATRCKGGACGGGKPRDCDDGNACTADTCDAATGQCTHKPIAGGCDDGEVCTLDICNAATGACSHLPAPGTCKADGGCLSGVCKAGHCAPGQMAVRTIAGSGSSSFADGPARDAHFYGPEDLVVDAAGTIFVTDSKNYRVRRIAAGGTVSTYAGNGVKAAIDGPRLQASLYYPERLELLANGDLLVADTYAHRLRLVTKSAVKTIAGGGPVGSSQGAYLDGKVAIARFNRPKATATRGDGLIFIADARNNRIRTLSPQGIVATFAGSGARALLDGVGTAASLRYPEDLALAADGTLYVADADNHAIRRITAKGIVSTVAGATDHGFVDGPGLQARFYWPDHLTLGPGGTLWLADTGNSAIRRIDPSGDVRTVIGGNGPGERDGPAAIARVWKAGGLFWTGDGRLLFTDRYNHRVRELLIAPPPGCDDQEPCTLDACNPKTSSCAHLPRDGVCRDGSSCTLSRCDQGKCTADGATLATLAGSGSAYRKDGVGEAASFQYPTDLLRAPDGRLYLADEDNNVIRRIDLAGRVTTFSGSGVNGMRDGPPASARYDSPRGIAIGPGTHPGTHWLYVSDTGNHRIRRLEMDGTSSAFAGSGTTASSKGGFADGPARTTARFNRPRGLEVAPDGSVWVADTKNHRIRRIRSGMVTTIAGGPAGGADGPGAQARFRYPVDLTFDAKGIAYVADRDNNAIRRIAADGSVTTLAGGTKAGRADGAGQAALFNSPMYLALTPGGALLVTDGENHRIRRLTMAGVVSTIAGSGRGFLDDTAAKAEMNYPTGIAVDPAGFVLVVDRDNHRIRLLQPAAGGCRSGQVCQAGVCVPGK